MVKLTQRQLETVEALRNAGAEETPADWRALGLNLAAVKALIGKGLLLPPPGEEFPYRNTYYRGGVQPTRTVLLSAAEVEGPGKAKKAKGTCPCCLRAMSLKDRKVVRHGWKEVGGGYGRGRGWHAGRCFGVAYPPLEVSSAGTTDLLAVIEAELLPEAEAELERLKNRPAEITFSYRGLDPKTRRYSELTRTLPYDGVSLEKGARVFSGRAKSYAYQLTLKIRNAERDLSSLRKDAETLREVLRTWEPKPLLP